MTAGTFAGPAGTRRANRGAEMPNRPHMRPTDYPNRPPDRPRITVAYS
jgi:hypothetical protein